MSAEKLIVLIIEDNPADARLVKETLSESNDIAYEFKYASMLSEGLKMISEDRFDLILLDLSLPDSTGLDSIKGIIKKIKDMPLIILTGTDDLNVVTQALKMGVQDYLVKGQFDNLALSRSIRYSVERKKNERELRNSEERYRSIFENSVIGIYQSTLEGKYTEANLALVKMLGYDSKEELLKLDIPKRLYLSEKDRPNHENRNKPFIIQLKKKEGTTIWAEISSKTIYENGIPKYYQGVVRDITEKIGAEENLKQSYIKIKETLNATIKTISNIVETKDPYTAGHQVRVARLCTAIAEELGFDKKKINAINIAALIHDIGKIGVPASILSKPSRLSGIEFEMVKTHSEIGYNIIKEIDFGFPIAEIIYQHHERLNGSGYPGGLKGSDIMSEAKILAVADTVESMSTHRPYRPALGIDKALKELKEGRGVLYDIDVVDTCIGVFRENKFNF